MTTLKYYFFLFALLLMISCEEKVATPEIEITTESDTYQAGMPVRFNIQGNADMISFYSGEPTNDYSFRDGRTIDVSNSTVTLAFTSAVTGGAQANQLRLLASTDFDGNYDNLASVQAATWTDITSRFTFGTSATFLTSTVQNVTDLLVPGKPIYFAFRYVTKPQATNGLARTWMIQSLSLKSSVLFNNAEVTIADQANAGFRIVDQEPVNAPSRSTITTSRIALLGNFYKDPADPIFDPANPIYDPANPIYDRQSPLYNPNAVRPKFVAYDPNSPYNDPQTETWAISKPIMVDQVDLGPDWSRSIKGIANPKLEQFQHTYLTPGTYTAHFIAINATIDGQEETIKEISLTITE